MIVDLMDLTTSDGNTLDGAFFAPAKDTSPKGPADAVLVIHGSMGNFCSPATKEIAQAAVNSPRAEYVIIEGGEHSLANCKQDASARVLNWLGSLTPQPVIV